MKELNCDRNEDNRILYCVDGVHGFGVDNTNVNEMGCDYFVAGVGAGASAHPLFESVFERAVGRY
ncbi:MAG: aspartate aminotransferase-like enzyme [Halioglobus sp.]|jgi:aspartate aminotransferase-like enzyme